MFTKYSATHKIGFYIAVQEMNGLLIDTCTNLEFDGVLGTGELEDSAFSAPTGGEQVANVVITGASSGIVFNDFIVGPGAGELFCCIEAEGRKRYAPRTLASSAASRLQISQSIDVLIFPNIGRLLPFSIPWGPHVYLLSDIDIPLTNPSFDALHIDYG